jgi:hypothetical protein
MAITALMPVPVNSKASQAFSWKNFLDFSLLSRVSCNRELARPRVLVDSRGFVRKAGPTYTTSASLLDQLRQSDAQQAWVRLVQLYAPLLHYWARRRGLQCHACPAMCWWRRLRSMTTTRIE